MLVRLLSINDNFRSLLVIIGVMLTFSLNGQVPDKASPFTAVKWDGEQPVVRWEGDWYVFQSINGISVESIIAFSKKTYENRWQKRFSEDFVEVLTKMGHAPDKEVNLILSQNDTQYSKTGTMSEDYRDMVRDFNNGVDALEQSGAQAETKNTESLSDNTSQQELARQMAAWIDKVWEENPPENTANLRFLFYKDSRIYAGKIDINGDFIFRAKSIRNHVQAFNPNKNGRWVFEELPPGTYNLSITGKNEFTGWSWSEEHVKVAPKTKPLFKINLK